VGQADGAGLAVSGAGGHTALGFRAGFIGGGAAEEAGRPIGLGLFAGEGEGGAAEVDAAGVGFGVEVVVGICGYFASGFVFGQCVESGAEVGLMIKGVAGQAAEVGEVTVEELDGRIRFQPGERLMLEERGEGDLFRRGELVAWGGVGRGAGSGEASGG